MLSFTTLALTATTLLSTVLSSPSTDGHNNLAARKAHTRRGHNAAGLRLRGNSIKRKLNLTLLDRNSDSMIVEGEI